MAAIDASESEGVVPITLLTGFLGSGKTTTLQHLLENKEGLRIGVIVNDVASVNIDSKLVKKSDSSDNGGDSITATTSLRDGVVELQNGCACCSLADELLPTIENLLDTKKKKNSADEEEEGFDALVVELSGVGDPVAIRQNWKMSRAQGKPVTKRADMKRVVTLVDASTFGTDFMTWETAGDREAWRSSADGGAGSDCAAARKVPELLAEQIEAADVLVLNKIDLAGPEQLGVAAALARSINGKAVLEEVEFGKVAAPRQILRDVRTAEAAEKEKEEESCGCCGDDDRSNAASATDDDDDHGHSHSHDHATAASHLGIVNFVYRADRPFHTKKLMRLLHTWPVPIKDDLGGMEHYAPESEPDDEEPAGRESPFFGVLRSKGFCWLSPTDWDPSEGDQWRHDTAMYWSHAGKHFGITAAGKWWATLDRDAMKDYFRNDPAEYDRITTEDFVSEIWGDRRQELVFIGANIDQDRITKALDDCLLTEAAMEEYTYQLNSLLY